MEEEKVELVETDEEILGVTLEEEIEGQKEVIEEPVEETEEESEESEEEENND